MNLSLPLQSENEVRRMRLIDSIRNEGLVVVVGTGVTIGSLDHSIGLPDVAGWQGLLRNGLARCYDQGMVSDNARDIVEAEINEGSVDFLVGAAQKITGWMDKRVGEKGHWLRETIGELKISKPGLIGAIANLGGVLATLNYDDLLTQVTRRQPYHWRDLPIVNTLLRDKKFDEFILHLHGHWKDPESVILDWKSYHAISNDDKTRQHLRDFTLSRTMLFIGCGGTFMDPNLQTWLTWAKSAMADEMHQHFILCRACDRQNLYRELSEHGYLAPIVYGELYEDLEPFLVKLSHDARKATGIPNELPTKTHSGIVAIPPQASKLTDLWPR